VAQAPLLLLGIQQLMLSFTVTITPAHLKITSTVCAPRTLPLAIYQHFAALQQAGFAARVINPHTRLRCRIGTNASHANEQQNAPHRPGCAVNDILHARLIMLR